MRFVVPLRSTGNGRAAAWTALLSLVFTHLLFASVAVASDQRAEPAAVKPHRVQAYKLESLELVGTTRMTAAALEDELDLKKETPLDDELVMTTRTKLLSLGLFRSAILIMRKGTKPGYAKLIVEVEDDGSVLTDWALGGELGVTMTETHASTADASTAPMDYRVALVGRNLLGELHRGSLYVGFDSEGKFREGQVAYGSPRFALEETQFDAEIAATSAVHRYLEALGFGGRGQGLWSRTLSGFGELQYGAAMYVNKGPEFAVPGFPSSVAGPKVAYYRETRLHGFFPGEGSLAGASLLLSPTDTEKSVFEIQLARTFNLWSLVYSTFDVKMLSVGIDGYALRAETRFDVPLGRMDPDEDQAELFLRLRGGQDRLDDTNLVGSAAILGVRYHSSGFIAELALKVTRSPEDLTPKELKKQSIREEP